MLYIADLKNVKEKTYYRKFDFDYKNLYFISQKYFIVT